jgi:hypothetical protein
MPSSVSGPVKSVNPWRLFRGIFVACALIVIAFETMIFGRRDWLVVVEALFSGAAFAAWATWKREWLFRRVPRPETRTGA